MTGGWRVRWRMADDFFFGQEAGEATAVSMHLPPRTPEYVNSLDGKVLLVN